MCGCTDKAPAPAPARLPGVAPALTTYGTPQERTVTVSPTPEPAKPFPWLAVVVGVILWGR